MASAAVLAIGAVASLAGGVVSAVQAQQAAAAQAAAIQYQAEFQAAAAEYDANQRERQANDARALAQREANKRRQEGDLLLSRQLAVSAAQGGATDPSVLTLFGQTFEDTELAAGTEIYTGETQARGLIDAANVSRYEGGQALVAGQIQADAALTAGRYQSVSSIFKGVSGAAGFYSKYGGSGGTIPTSGYRYD